MNKVSFRAITVYRQEEQTLILRLTLNEIEKIMSVMSLKYIPVTQSILCLILLMHVRTIQYLQWTRILKKASAVYDSNIPVTLKQG